MSKLALTAPQTIPLDKLAVHDGNVRHIKAGVSIESLAADIARRGLLQSLSVRPLRDQSGEETGTYGVQAGSRRFRALQLLVKQKKLAKNAPVPCIVRTEGFVEADSLAENTEREALHPLDQFRAFAALRDKGEGEESIAAAFGVTPAVVKQRLRLAKASPVLRKAYEDDQLTLDQLMAYCLIDDHARQERVFEAVNGHWNNHPAAIRRMLTETSVRADDPRAVFVGAEAYEAAGGVILRDLFDEDDGGWLQDVPLLEKLVGEKLAAAADEIKAEGWGWVETAEEFPWNHKRDYQSLKPVAPALTEEQAAELEALTAEFEELDATPEDELTATAKKRLKQVKQLIAHLESFQPVYDEAEMAGAGVFISLDGDGALSIERGYVRPVDVARPVTGHANDAEGESSDPETGEIAGAPSDDTETGEDKGPALPDRLRTELTAYRTLALRNALADNPDIAFLAVLHTLSEQLFYRFDYSSCLQIKANDTLTSPFPGLAEFKANQAIEARHKSWAEAIPENSDDLWDWLSGLDRANREALFAHCTGLTINAVFQAYNRSGKALRHGDTLAAVLGLDMSAAGWATTAENYFGRLTKAAILDAVREAKDAPTADRLANLKKKEMAQEAERLIEGTGWLPELLRTPQPVEDVSDHSLPAFLEEEVLQAAE